MKTLSHYQKLREDYACIIPKTAPAWELIEAVDDLIKLLTPHPDAAPNTRIVDASGVSVAFPEGWSLVSHEIGWVVYTLHDNVRQRGHIAKTNRNSFLVEFDNVTIGDYNHLPGAVCCLSNASVNVPVENQPHFLGVPVNLPKGWVIAINHESDTITLTDSRGVRRGSVYRNLKDGHVVWWDCKYKTTFKTQQDAIEWLNNKANES